MAGDESSAEVSLTPRVTSPMGTLPEADEREALVRQILASRTFAKSVRLSQFFDFICRKTLEGHPEQINEQQIGVHVFGRSPAYNATDDSIVRTQARLLRLRLEEYFEHECPACPMIVLIPKGGYVPVFERRRDPRIGAEPAGVRTEPLQTKRDGNPVRDELDGGNGKTPAAAPASRAPALEAPERAKPSPWAVAFVVLVLGALAMLWLRPLHLSHGGQASLWKGIFGAGRPVVIVPSDDGLVLTEELRRAPVSLDEYLSGSYLREAATGIGEPGSETGRVTAAWLASHQYTSTADLGLAMRLNRLPEANSAQVETRYARALHLEDLKNRNVILIGGIGANPWVGLFSNVLNFDVNYDWKSEQGYVVNKAPQTGEQARYQEQRGKGGATSYGVLAYLPGVNGQGSALLFEGSGMAGTEAASDFPFNAEAFATFLKKLGVVPGAPIPYFEVLLATRSLGGDAPEPRVVAWRRVDR